MKYIACMLALTCALVTSSMAQQPSAVREGASASNLQQRVAKLEAEVAELKNVVKQPQATTRPEHQTSSGSGSDLVPGEGSAITAEDRSNLDFLRGTTINLGVDGYYAYNFNSPIGRVNLLRAYDVLSNSFSLNQANLVIEHAPNVAAGKRFGGRLDLQFGQATETLQGSAVNELRPQVYRPVFQAYGTYVFPLGSGLTVDFGKWGSALGIENNYTKDQMNYSRSYFFNFLPFYHMGVRATYQF